jgi:hypothetical protein
VCKNPNPHLRGTGVGFRNPHNFGPPLNMCEPSPSLANSGPEFAFHLKKIQLELHSFGHELDYVAE